MKNIFGPGIDHFDYILDSEFAREDEQSIEEGDFGFPVQFGLFARLRCAHGLRLHTLEFVRANASFYCSETTINYSNRFKLGKWQFQFSFSPCSV